MELKASLRQLTGGAHWTFHVGGAECLCQPSGLHKPFDASARGSYPAPLGGSWSQGILGQLGRRNSLPDALFFVETALQESYGSQAGCHVWSTIFVRCEGVLGSWLASTVPSLQLRK